MALKVIGAGLGRTARFSVKFALEHVGLGSCYHMTEVFANARRNIPLWLDVVNGTPDWDTIFDGYQRPTIPHTAIGANWLTTIRRQVAAKRRTAA